jgi:hypothetical protein
MTMFTTDQREALSAPLKQSNVKTRKQGNSNLSYVEGWKVIEEANRIFGFDGWTRKTTFKCVAERERKIGARGDAGWGVTYIATVEVVVFAGDDTLVTRQGVGAGHGIDRDLGQAHESALKEAETDATKRALMTFGYQFGLALYDKDKENVEEDRSHEDREAIADKWADRRAGELARGAQTKPNGQPLPQNDTIWDEEGERPAAASDFEATTGVLKASYLESARDYIRKSTNEDTLRTWWFSKDSVKAREDFELTPVESSDLSRFCKAKIDELRRR